MKYMTVAQAAKKWGVTVRSVVAVFCRMPYGYYTLLKVICCAGFAYLAYRAHGKGELYYG